MTGSEIMPRNKTTTSVSHPSEEEPSSHRGRSRRLARDRADQDDAVEMPRTTHRRRARPDTLIDLLSEPDSENLEALRGRSAERSPGDGERLASSSSISTLATRPRHRHSEGSAEGSTVAFYRARVRHDVSREREFPWFGHFYDFRSVQSH